MSMTGIKVINRGLEQRKFSSGRVKHTVRIEAEPVVVDLDPKRLGRPIADGIAEHLRKAVQGIAAVASPSTLLKRKYAMTAFMEGKSWAMKRYSGGRIGTMQPAQSDRLFNDSGRFAQSITANASSDGSWRVNVASNRLDSKSAGEAGVLRIWNRLVELIPEFANAGLIFEKNNALRQTLRRVVEERIKVGKLSDKELTPFQAFRMLNIPGKGE